MKRKKPFTLLLTALLLAIVVAVSAVTTAHNIRQTAKPVQATPSQAAAAVRDETLDNMRGIWVTYMDLSMEYEADKSEAAFRKKFDTIATACRDLGCNALFVQVRPFCDALYASKLFPASHILSGTQGKSAGYDALQIMCDISHGKGLKLHAWINPYRVIANQTPEKLSADNPCVKDESMVLKTDTDVILDPSNEKANKLILDGVMEIADNYPVDGIHFDDYFYPPEMEGQDDAQYQAYRDKAPQGKAMDVATWRCYNVNMLIAQTYLSLHREHPEMVFGVSPQGNLGNNAALSADVVNWCAKKGFIDYICPQLYFSLDNPALGFEQALSDWTALDYADGVRLYVGLGCYKAGTDADEGTWLEKNDILAEEINILKKNDKVKGVVLYSYASLYEPSAQQEINNLEKALNAPAR